MKKTRAQDPACSRSEIRIHPSRPMPTKCLLKCLPGNDLGHHRHNPVTTSATIEFPRTHPDQRPTQPRTPTVRRNAYSSVPGQNSPRPTFHRTLLELLSATACNPITTTVYELRTSRVRADEQCSDVNSNRR